MRHVIAWESEEARDESGSYGYPYRDRPVARARWRQVKDHPVPGLSVYKASEPKETARQHDQARQTEHATPNEKDERDRGTPMDIPPGEPPARQLRLKFDRTQRQDPNQHTIGLDEG